MAIKSRNKVEPTFNSSSMSDLVFLLLIFFMLTSTLVAPNAIKLMLPSSTSKTMAKQTVTVYVDENYQYQVNDIKVFDESQLMDLINTQIGNDPQATVVLRSDKTVPVQYIVNVIDAVNEINNATGNNHKVILATSPKK
ncbi:MAG: biopolymer transporter ExbD [Bacteroidales bacterium]|jgi:biopolymer transport protein ExbD|nr:biopolymer transporter ExbD [Bacteroidales bacterium]MBR5631478.1 biopolymer transporter ExbD [Bacteroidales bacterium]